MKSLIKFSPLRFFLLMICCAGAVRLTGHEKLGLDFERDRYFAQPLFSFTYGGKSSAELLPQWQKENTSRSLDDRRIERRVVWTDPVTGLQVRWVGVEYRDFPAIEWTVFLKNTGRADTPVVNGIQAMDLSIERKPGSEFVLHGTKGDWCTADSFEPYAHTLAPGDSRHFAPFGGRPTNAAFPYYNLQGPGGGVFLAIGWPGQWASSFVRDAQHGLAILAGQETTRFFLKPGEEVRSPLIALLFWRGEDTVLAQNQWRRWMIAHNLPRTADGKLPPPQIVACSSHQFKEMTEANEANQKLFIDRYLEEGMKLDYWWMDAGWYPCDGKWTNTGTWEPDATRFPRGLRPISDHARAKGVKTIVWFEPERVGDPNSWLAKNHPEWLLTKVGEPLVKPKGGKFSGDEGRLLNFGNPEALHWVINHVDRTLTEQGIDYYRQDFNLEPLRLWRGADGPDREGIAENLYIQGYLAYWDALRERHSSLIIDTCASGGRRNDLETLRRSVPLLRSDYLFEPTGQQNHHAAYAAWIPYHGTGYAVGVSTIGFKISAGIDRYDFRSTMSPSVNLCYDMRRSDLDYALARQLFDQQRQIGPSYMGDFYPLTPYSLGNEVWMAWQYDRPEAAAGVVQAFRRPEATLETGHFKLRGLDPAAKYRVTDLDRPSESRTFRGEELAQQGIPITIAKAPGAVVLAYEKVP